MKIKGRHIAPDIRSMMIDQASVSRDWTGVGGYLDTFPGMGKLAFCSWTSSGKAAVYFSLRDTLSETCRKGSHAKKREAL